MKIRHYKLFQIFIIYFYLQVLLFSQEFSFEPGNLEATKKLSGVRPNIILFLADDQSKTDHTVYGNEKVPTLVTEEFSKESLVFENTFTGQAICAPSRSMLLTGLYPLKNGCYINHTAIRPGIKTLPAYLTELG